MASLRFHISGTRLVACCQATELAEVMKRGGSGGSGAVTAADLSKFFMDLSKDDNFLKLGSFSIGLVKPADVIYIPQGVVVVIKSVNEPHVGFRVNVPAVAEPTCANSFNLIMNSVRKNPLLAAFLVALEAVHYDADESEAGSGLDGDEDGKAVSADVASASAAAATAASASAAAAAPATLAAVAEDKNDEEAEEEAEEEVAVAIDVVGDTEAAMNLEKAAGEENNEVNQSFEGVEEEAEQDIVITEAAAVEEASGVEEAEVAGADAEAETGGRDDAVGEAEAEAEAGEDGQDGGKEVEKDDDYEEEVQEDKDEQTETSAAAAADGPSGQPSLLQMMVQQQQAGKGVKRAAETSSTAPSAGNLRRQRRR